MRRPHLLRNRLWALVSISAASTTLLLSLLSRVPEAAAAVYPSNHEPPEFDRLPPSRALQGITRPAAAARRDAAVPLIITNNCPDVLWPGIASQAGDAPAVHGFELGPGRSRKLTVGPTWAGRVWGRTNCTVGGDTATCRTGDCLGKLNCIYGGEAPATLAEFNLAGGVAGAQTFYDISLVDGYNLPLGIVYHEAAAAGAGAGAGTETGAAGGNATFIPPNLANPACIATAGFLGAPSAAGLTYTNATYPMPYEPTVTNRDLAGWCPWDLQAFPSLRPPGDDGIYPYPDDDAGVRRPVFDPCLSACASTHRPSDCCTGPYGDPDVCRPSLYSRRAKAVCPDAYSYAFDDRSSTFIVPRGGGGWEVVFCPEGRSTNIQATFADELHRIASGGAVDVGFVESKTGGGRGGSSSSSSVAAAETVAPPSRGYVMLCMVVAVVYLILSFG